MEIGSIINVLQSVPEASALKAGDLLKIHVVEVFENQRILADMGRWRTMAEISFPVAPGDEFWVRVQAASGQLRLQRVPPPDGTAPAGGPVTGASAQSLHPVWMGAEELAKVVGRLSDSGPMPHDVRPLLETLRGLLGPFDLGSPADALSAKLKLFCENCGLFLESRLGAALERAAEGPDMDPAANTASPAAAARVLANDLKARLLFLKAFLEAAKPDAFDLDRGAAAGLNRAVTGVLADIRGMQEQMVKTASAEQPFQMVHFALPTTDAPHPVQLKIAYWRRRAREKQDGHRAAILLALDRVGPVRADLFLLGRSLNISIFVSSAELQNVFARHAPDMRAALAEWFDPVGVQVKVSARTIERFVSEDWRPAGESLVDVRI